MNRSIWLALVVLAAFIGGYYLYDSQRPSPPLPQLAPVGATLLEGLGSHGMRIATGNRDAQRWFDQALALTYGFNHDAAERSFLQATELDPECVMCWWGAALVLGPHVNAEMDPAAAPKAWERLQRARTLAAREDTDPRERSYVEALAARYAAEAPEDRRPLDEAYARAMAQLVSEYPEDLDAATLRAESLMNLQPWDYWGADGRATGNTPLIVSSLEAVLARNPDHPGALHLYIHAVEASPDPQRGAIAADRLRELVPGSGHLVHMPAHIYARVGRYHDAVIANQKAIRADDAYLSICRPLPGVYPLGYVPHNHHFLWFAATMEGASAIALEAAEATRERTSDPTLLRTPGFEGMQVFALTPLFAQVRFARWDDIASTPQPDGDLPYMVAMWHYAQGIAAVRRKRMDEARTHAAAVASAAADPAFDAMKMWGRYPLSTGVKIAERVLAAELARAARDFDRAIAALTEAAALEDALPYDEPPGWHAPVRHTLGAVLLEAGRPAEAATVYGAELRRNPENGWSLHGLARALEAQGLKARAAEIETRFERAWINADVAPTI